MIQENIGGLDIAMYNAFAMRIAQRVSDECNRTEYVLNRRSRQDAQIGTIDKLQAIERAIGVVVVLEYARNMRVHESNTGLPFLVKISSGNAFAGEYLERDGRAR